MKGRENVDEDKKKARPAGEERMRNTKTKFPHMQQAMEEQGRRIGELAEQIGMQRSTLRHKMQGRTQFTLEEMRTLQRVLGGYPLDYLFEEEGEDESEKYCKFFMNGVCQYPHKVL